MGGFGVNVQATADLDGEAVSRPRVLELLRDAQYRVVSMVAPAGYGKSTALRAFLSDGRAAHYVQPDTVRDDGTDLLHRVRRALDTGEPYALAVDGIRAPAPTLLTALFLHVHSAPSGSTLLVSSRRPIDWATALDVAGSQVRQIGPAELALTSAEARDVLAASAPDIEDADADRLFTRTRGWPIAHYLCALLLRDAPRPDRVVDEIVATDGELLRGLVHRLVVASPAVTRRFLTRTSILRTLSGPLCDWLLQTSGSDDRLAALAHDNVLVMPVYGARGTYRYQRLFGELLRGELNDYRPETASFLHLRAGDWFADHGDDVAARWHRQAAHSSSRPGADSVDLDEKIVVGAPDLSLAELQVLAFLPSHLSFDEIGMRLGRSGRAIQLLAIGIYRKLGVISRRDAVERGLVLGLVAEDALSFPT